MEEEKEEDPINSLLSSEEEEDLPSSRELALKDDHLSLKQKTKDILHKAGPRAAERLAHVVETGDDKEAVSAAASVLDRIGFSKSEGEPAKSSQSILPQAALVAALLGIGKVLGLQERSSLEKETAVSADFRVVSEEETPSVRSKRVGSRRKTKKAGKKA